MNNAFSSTKNRVTKSVAKPVSQGSKAKTPAPLVSRCASCGKSKR